MSFELNHKTGYDIAQPCSKAAIFPCEPWTSGCVPQDITAGIAEKHPQEQLDSNFRFPKIHDSQLNACISWSITPPQQPINGTCRAGSSAVVQDSLISSDRVEHNMLAALILDNTTLGSNWSKRSTELCYDRTLPIETEASLGASWTKFQSQSSDLPSRSGGIGTDQKESLGAWPM